MRADNKGAKAGNLNNGLRLTATKTNAPLILVLDADFAPQPNILRRMVGLFDDPQTAVVQSPQFFFNADPIQHNLGIVGHWVDDQRIFFDVFQPAKDAWGCAFCVGTSFLVRRDRLMEIGGFPDDAICEDLNLSCAMMRRGYQTHWLNERLSSGLSAEGLPEYITQRTRWCLGTLQVAFLAEGPLRGGGYSLAQRLHFIHGVLNWLCKPFLLLMLIAPAIYWFLGAPAFEADYLDFLHYGAPMLIATYAYNGWISRSRTLPLFMEVTHAMTALAITATLAIALKNPFGRPFKVTEKGGDRSAMRVRWRLAAGFAALSLFSAASIVWAVVSPDAPLEVSPMDCFNLLWSGISMVLTFVALLVCVEHPRGENLFATQEQAAFIRGRTRDDATIVGLSTNLARVRFHGDVPPAGVAGNLLLPGGEACTAEIIHCDDDDDVMIRLYPDLRQRRALMTWLFAVPRDVVATRANLAGAVAGLLDRAFRLA